MWQYDVYADRGGHSRWRLKASNGAIVAVSGESFASHSNAVRAAQNFKTHARQLDYEVYADSGGHYRWRAKAGNGQKVASAGESVYTAGVTRSTRRTTCAPTRAARAGRRRPSPVVPIRPSRQAHSAS